MGASSEHSLGGALHEHLRLSARSGGAVGRHRLAVARELERELLQGKRFTERYSGEYAANLEQPILRQAHLLPLGLDDAVGDVAEVALRQARLGRAEDVHLLSQHDEGGLGGLSDLLVHLLGLQRREIDTFIDEIGAK